MRTKQIISFLFWAVVFGLTGLLLWNSRGYLFHPESVAFYRERIPEVPDVWRFVLIPHVVGGLICLIAGPFLFSPLPKVKGRFHAVLGMVYMVGTLGIMLPTGIWLSFYAHGGLAGRLGFLFTGFWMSTVTLLGLYALRQHNYLSHIHWMMRSYALALSALTFRLVYVSGYYLGLSYEYNYPLSTWLSTIINLCIVEGIIRLNLNPHPKPKGDCTYEKNKPVNRIVPVAAAHPRRR